MKISTSFYASESAEETCLYKNDIKTNGRFKEKHVLIWKVITRLCKMFHNI